MYNENVIVIRIGLNDLKTWFWYQWQRTLWTLCSYRRRIAERWKKVENDKKYFD